MRKDYQYWEKQSKISMENMNLKTITFLADKIGTSKENKMKQGAQVNLLDLRFKSL